MDCQKNLSEKDRYWLKLIQECRTSGKSDYQWLQENNIASPTFYYHVKQLRKKACEIPQRNSSCRAEVQEVVPLVIEDDPEYTQPFSGALQDTSAQDTSAAVRLSFRGVTVDISTGATQEIIQNTISALRFLC